MTPICKLLREFALEYRTCRERVLQQQKKRAAHRERNKTRGRLITEVQGHSASCHHQVMPPQVPNACLSSCCRPRSSLASLRLLHHLLWCPAALRNRWKQVMRA